VRDIYPIVFLTVSLLLFRTSGQAQQSDSLEIIKTQKLIEPYETNVDSVPTPFGLDLGKKKTKKYKLAPMPILLVTPETDLVVGLALQAYWKFGKSPVTFTSTASTTIQYTTRKQLISWTKWDFFLKENRLRLNGELKYQKYPNKYWGIGYNTPNEFESNYSYKQVFLNFKWLTSIKDIPLFFGISYRFNYQYDIQPLDTPNILSDIERPTGYKKFLNNGIGLAAMWDTRDHNIYPYSGVWAQLTTHYFLDRDVANINDEKIQFFSMQLDIREYFSFFKNLKTPHVLALQQYININSDDPPFDVLSKVGGDLYGRGYWEGRYRDRVMMSMQAEYRLPLFWRIGMVGFAGVSEVASDFGSFKFDQIKWFAGTGIRFAMFPKDRVNLRVDFGFGRDGSRGVYFKLNESF
jgi:outer membrane protein assembly factor BamA